MRTIHTIRCRSALSVLLPLAVFAPTLLGAGATFRVTISAGLAAQPVSGRLVLGLIAPGSKLGPETSPLDAPFWTDQQPIFAIDGKDLAPGHPVVIDDHADFSFAKPSDLKPGTYKVAARLIANRQTSNWRHDTGNLFSQTVTFTIPDGGDLPPVEIALSEKTTPRAWPEGMPPKNAQLFESRSTLLSDFKGRDVMSRAGIVYPAAFDASRKYPAIYFVPGFGGDHFDAVHMAADRAARAASGDSSPQAQLDRETFVIVLDPESPNGHTLFADSDNNGPCGKALTQELIPALEAKLPLIAKPEARLLRGHSSGGWSTLWLALTYPEVFSATWSSSPDPIDFRMLELCDIYSDGNIYTGRRGPIEEWTLQTHSAVEPPSPRADALKAQADWPSFRTGGGPAMTVREENASERLLGPDRTSGQQWASWQAVWGPRSPDGSIAALYDDKTGVIHKNVLNHYLKYDIGYQLRTNPARLAPLFLDRVRIVVGGADSFYLEEAVTLVKAELDRMGADQARAERLAKGESAGYITIVPGKDHGTVFDSEEIRRFPSEMLDYLRRTKVIPAAADKK